jgi:hypothetical protein
VLRRRLRPRIRKDDCWRDVGQQFEAFLAKLRKHERAENAIVQSSFNDDVGSVD